MNSISEQVLQAVEIVVDEKISKLEYDKTKQGKIYSIENINTGEYRVTLNGAHVLAYAEDTSETYKVGEAVYVKIPEGDMSNKKIITSRVTSSSLNESQLMQLSNSIIEVSSYFDELYGNIYDRTSRYGVIAGAKSDLKGKGWVPIFENDSTYQPDGYHGMFQQYSSKYEYIRLKASFLTQFHSTHTKGNYGIEVEFYTNDNGSVSYRLQCSNFNGNPYGFSVYTPQEIVIKAQKNYLVGLKSIKLFQENFIYDKVISYDGTPDKEIIDVANIFVKDIILQYVDKLDLSDVTYYLTIAAPRGMAFTSKVDKLSLVGRLIYKGEDIINKSKVSCQWYERDLSVMVGDDDYSKAAGFGWRPIAGATDSTIILSSADTNHAHQSRYKLVAVYNEETTLTAEIEIKNLNSKYDYFIAQVTEGANIKLQLKEKNTSESLVGNWYLSYPDGSYNSVQQGENKNSILIGDYLTYSSVIFYCEVYNEKGVYLGTIEHTILSSESAEDVTVTYLGEDTFRYDANGDITIEDSEKERALQAVITWKNGYASAFGITWLVLDEDGDEVELPRTKDLAYSPDNAMIENLWVDTNNYLHYNIKQKYKVNYNNNNVIMRITTITEDIYSFDKEILFLKDGDQGTNGTTYITTIRPCDSDGNKLSGLNPLRYNSGWQNYLRLHCYVYKDGELINGALSSRYKFAYKWEGSNITLENKLLLDTTSNQVVARGVPTISADTASKEMAFYAKVQVTITDTNGDKIVTYASYPLDVIIGSATASDINIDDVPSYIKYTSSGLTPSYYSNDINFYYKGIAYNNNIKSLNTNLLTIVERDGKKYLEAASSFIFENVKENSESNIGVLSFDIPNSDYRLIHPIIMYLDTYGNEAINGWDGTALKLDETNKNYIFAPQVGAGTKDSANRFTGVVMGKDSGQDKIGLYGYQAGVNTFGLTQDGKAFFGAKSGGGQIVIDGTSATLSGGGGGDSEVGMTITLADLNPNKTTYAIKVGAGKFSITYAGVMSAIDAEIEGTIYATKGRIGCSSKSSTDGWVIEKNRLYSGSGATRVELNSDPNETYAIWAGNASSASAASSYFAVSKKGALYAKEGNIGGWTLKKTSFSNATNKIGMASAGAFTFWSGADSGTPGNTPTFSGSSYFYVKSDGKLYCKNADIDGKVTADSGKIGGWTITSSSLYAGNTYLYSSGRIVASNASISGTINATTLTCNSGSIGGWAITSSGLFSDYISLYSNGHATMSELEIETTTITYQYDSNGNIIGATVKANDSIGTIGMINGSDGQQTTNNLGLKTTDPNKSIILVSARNLALQATNGGTIMLGEGWDLGSSIGYLRCTIPKERQFGIYAQFA